jgi:hypothetical protein
MHGRRRRDDELAPVHVEVAVQRPKVSREDERVLTSTMQ